MEIEHAGNDGSVCEKVGEIIFAHIKQSGKSLIS